MQPTHDEPRSPVRSAPVEIKNFISTGRRIPRRRLYLRAVEKVNIRDGDEKTPAHMTVCRRRAFLRFFQFSSFSVYSRGSIPERIKKVRRVAHASSARAAKSTRRSCSSTCESSGRVFG